MIELKGDQHKLQKLHIRLEFGKVERLMDGDTGLGGSEHRTLSSVFNGIFHF